MTDPVFRRECALGKRAVARSPAPAELGDKILCQAIGLPSPLASDRGRVEFRRVLMY